MKNTSTKSIVPARSNTNQSLASLARRSQAQRYQHHVVVVADLGPEADYRNKPKIFRSIVQPFAVNRKSNVSLLRRFQRMVRNALGASAPFDQEIYIWTLDRNDKPKLFVTGQIAVLTGTTTKQEAAELHQRIWPQVTPTREEHAVELVVRARGEIEVDTERCPDDEALEHDELIDLENEAIEAHFSNFDDYWLADTDYCEGDEVFTLACEGWKKLTVSMPFLPTEDMPADQIRYAVQIALATVSQVAMSGVPASEEDCAVWVLDKGKPAFNLPLLLDRHEGRLTNRNYKKQTERTRATVPSQVLAVERRN